MKKKALLLMFFVSSVLFAQGQSSVLKGEYLGQKPPGLTKQLFAPGVISTDAPEG